MKKFAQQKGNYGAGAEPFQFSSSAKKLQLGISFYMGGLIKENIDSRTIF